MRSDQRHVRLEHQPVEDGVETTISITLAWNLALALSVYSLAGSGTPKLDASMLASQGRWMQKDAEIIYTRHLLVI